MMASTVAHNVSAALAPLSANPSRNRRRLRARAPMIASAYTYDGRKFRMLNIVDAFTHECLAIRVARRLKASDVIDVLSDLFILRGVPGHICSDNVLRREGGRGTG